VMAVTCYIKHEDERVRIAAIKAAEGLADTALQPSVALVLLGLDDASPVRQTSLEALGHIAHQNVHDLVGPALSCIMSLMKSTSRSKQKTAASAIAASWPRGDVRVVKAICLELKHESSKVRRAALECLAVATQTQGPDGLQCIAEVVKVSSACLEDPEERVRNAAVKVLGALAAPFAIDLSPIRLLTGHPHAAVRCSSVEALAVSAKKGDDLSTALLVQLTKDDDGDVRWSALRALGHIASKGDVAVKDAMCRCVDDPDEQVRVAAVENLSNIADRGDEEAVRLLRRCLKDAPSPDFQREVLRTMLALFDAGMAAEVMEEAGIV